ncbi:hypothetical protein L0222_27560 [bacterium]|nr:hypothetical protein [bacterium]MCI0606737.1 hypothetical protein [bacterium]
MHAELKSIGLIKHHRYEVLSKEEKGKAVTVFESTTPDGKKAFLKLLEKDIDGKPALASRGYGSTETLLDELHRLSTSDFDAKFDPKVAGVGKDRVMEDLLKEVSDPDHYINQDNRDVCTVTSITHSLAAKNPAEYARITADLATRGTSRLANGDFIRPTNDSWKDDGSNRSVGERLVHSGLMDYARPGGIYENIDPGLDGKKGTADDGTDRFTVTGTSGLVDAESLKILKGLHGYEFEVYMDGAGGKKDVLDKIKEELGSSRGPVLAGFDWGGTHMVNITKVEGDRVYFRNPWGGYEAGILPGVGATGSKHLGPARRTDDGWSGIESMSTKEYMKSGIGIIIPKAMSVPAGLSAAE